MNNMLNVARPDLAAAGSSDNLFLKTIYYLYIVIAIICFSPFKIIAYFSPFIFLLGLLLIFPYDRFYKRLLICLLVTGIIISFYGIVYPHTIIQNALIAMLTYSCYVPLVVLPSCMLSSEVLLKKVLTFNQKLLLLEGILGIIQAIYGFLKNGTFSGANGDGVEGTIDIALEPQFSFANVMFSANMGFLCLLALVAVIKFRHSPYPLIVGVLSVILASVVHIIFFIVFSALIITFINLVRLLRNPKTLLILLISVIFTIGIASYFIGGNLATVSQYAAEREEFPKSIITNEVLYVIPKEYPAMPYIGLGPGQFSSRASLIGSGRYFGNFFKPTPVPLITPKKSAPMEKFVIPIWTWSASVSYFGSTQQPFYSWLSIYSEFGFLGSLIVIGIFIYLLVKTILLKVNRQNSLNNFVFQTGVLFLFFLGGQENYWEVAQAILIGLFLLKLLYANIFYSNPT
jgi:hypothetical protein